jgi:hypothetical protein
MKNLKYFESFINDNLEKLNETGEWDNGVDWKYVQEHPEDKDRCASWIRELEDGCFEIKHLLNKEIEFEIKNIRGFDTYQGPYATVKINGKTYKIWTQEDNLLWIENYKFDNTSDEKNTAGLIGTPDEIAEIILNTEK